ncbi:MAG: DUF1176 domain-containing protein [Candidatus Electronema sp. VV]
MANEADFSHKTWDLVCDNTRTCRTAGYSSADDENLSTMLLTRKAGPNTPVSMELQFPANEDESAPSEVRLTVGRLVLANIAVEKELLQEIAAKLLSGMPNEEEMTLTAGDKQWTLSLAGLKAMLLKMDDKQGRVGTPGALIAKGTKPENQVLPPIPMKTLIVPIIPPTTKEDKKILAALKEFLDMECTAYGDYSETERRIDRLSNDKLLVSMLVDIAAYNQTVAVWIVNDKPPYNPKPAIEGGEVYNSTEDKESAVEVVQNKGILHSSARGRGMADCWFWASWAWTGKSFEKATESSSGRCRGFIGGTWDLPTFVSKVVNKNEKMEQ